MKAIYLIFGVLFLGVGIVGIVTPLLPTTPFLLLAAWFFARSSERFHHWLMTHPELSPPIRDWQTSGVIRRPAKRLATALILVNAAFPVFIIQGIALPIRLVVAAVATMVLWFIWSRPDEP